MIKIINNDCLIALKEMESNSVDSVVTDPPYGISFMGKEWDSFDPKYQEKQMERESKRRPRKDGRKATGFQGSAYAGIYDLTPIGMARFQLWYMEIMKECLRVLKPGGHLLSFGSPRTYHRMACAIEDAGFEIRDQIQWLYGSGFPKSLDISKQFDKINGTHTPLLIPTKEGNTKYDRGTTYSTDTHTGFRDISKPSCDDAQQWEGWGTALKPANEPICLARKPMSEKTIAENVLKWGTGGINIDGCRVETDDKINPVEGGIKRRNKINQDMGFRPYENGLDNQCKEVWEQNTQGRFPANVIHDGSEEVVSQFPNGGAIAPVKKGHNGESKGIYGDYAEKGDDGASFHGDGLGSASRFFYCAKASKGERNKGLEDFEEIRHADRKKDDGSGGDNPRNRTNNPRQNFHPTVKPVSLMQYLCRLITPVNGTILDPFMGSGSTGIGAKVEGFHFIGIERESEYCKIAQARIEAWEGKIAEDNPKPKIIELTLWNQC